MKLKAKIGVIQTCPMCNALAFDYISYTDEIWGGIYIVEQHGLCYRCGFTIEQAYSSEYYAFWDVKRGFKLPSGEYVPKNTKKHKRIRKKLGIKNIEVNPRWIYFI